MGKERGGKRGEGGSEGGGGDYSDRRGYSRDISI